MNINTPAQRKNARSLLLLGLDALDALDREQKWLDSPGKFSQSVADRRREAAGIIGREKVQLFNERKAAYEAAEFGCEYISIDCVWAPHGDNFGAVINPAAWRDWFRKANDPTA